MVLKELEIGLQIYCTSFLDHGDWSCFRVMRMAIPQREAVITREHGFGVRRTTDVSHMMVEVDHSHVL